HPSGVCFVGIRKQLYRSINHGKTWSPIKDSLSSRYYINGAQRQFGIAVLGQNNRMIFPGYYSDDGKTFIGSPWGSTSLSTDNNGKSVNIWGAMGDFSDRVGGPGVVISSNNGTNFYIVGPDNAFSAEPEQGGDRNSVFFRNTEFFAMHAQAGSCVFLPKDTLLLSFPGIGILKTVFKLYNDPIDNYAEYLIKYRKDVTDNGFVSRYPSCSYMLKDSTILMGSYGSGLFMSNDKGEHWQSLDFPHDSPIITMFYNDIPRKRILAGTVNGLYESNNNGINWQRIDSGFHRPIITSLAVTSKGTIIASSYNKSYRKELKDKRWSMIPQLSDFEFTVTQLHCTGDSIFATKLDVFLSKDDGKSFTKLPFKYEKSFSKLLAYNKASQTLLTIGSEHLNRFSKGAWGEQQYYLYEYNDPYIENTSQSWTSAQQVNFSHISPYTEQIYLSLHCGITTYDWASGTVAKNKTDGEWLFGEWCFGITSDQKGRPFAATMNGIAYSPKNDKKWEYLPQTQELSLPAMMTTGTDDDGYIYSSSLFGGVYRTKKPVIILEAPSLVSPAGDAQEQLLTTIVRWKAALDAKQYSVQIAEDSLFQTIIHENTLAFTSTETLPLKPNRRYYWRVKSVLFRIESPWSEIRSFSTLTVYPSKVTLRQPVNKEINRPVTVSLLWNPTTEADSFDVHVASDNAFTMTALRDSMIAKREIQLNNLQQGTEYFWRVRGKNRAGYGPWSETWSFTTQSPSGISEDDNSGMSVTVQNNHVILHYGAYSQSVKGIRITDIRGKTILSQTIEQGQSSSDFDMSGMSKGYYVVILDTHTGSISRNVIVE
ncbi:MAG TPA: hypothetical protein PLW09_00940, partial [Candidatus Kapabacteria bacterium]|nr:hypothetical protein [Candidatus Kapabacteria bacterium]